MAIAIPMVRQVDGAMSTAYSGFSWTTLLFAGFPALFRGHFLGFIVQFFASIVTLGFSWLIFPFFYNGWHRSWLLGKGFGPVHGGAANVNNSSTNQHVVNVHVGDVSQVAQRNTLIPNEQPTEQVSYDNVPSQNSIPNNAPPEYLPPEQRKIERDNS